MYIKLLLSVIQASDWWVVLLSSATGAFLVKYVVQTFEAWRKRRGVEEHGKSLKSIVTIYETLASITKISGAQRSLVLASFNGGGVPNPTSKVKSSVLYEELNTSGQSLKDEWQNREADAAYARLLLRLYSEGELDIDVATMDEGVLKTTYMAHNIGHVAFRRLGVAPERMIYLSISFPPGATWNTPVIKNQINLAVSQLKQIFLDHKQVFFVDR